MPNLPTPPGVCPVTHKVQYRTHAEARRYLQQIRAMQRDRSAKHRGRGGLAPSVLAEYKCKHCQLWHTGHSKGLRTRRYRPQPHPHKDEV